jgi:(1->4)-alpha-D-glucan 1-alpha-D-glucosylmutase
MSADQTIHRKPRIPVSTYRLQLNRNFKFKEATKLIEYIRHLGITDVYSSPLLKARTGSLHCYDVTDHGEINPEIGSIRQFQDWSSKIRSARMGLLLDIVPNHMALSHENSLLMDVLEYGPRSRYSNFFDINWSPPKRDLKNRILLPILGEHLSDIINAGKLKFGFSQGFYLGIYDQKLPLSHKSYATILKLIKNRMSPERNDPTTLPIIESLIESFDKMAGPNNILTDNSLQRPENEKKRLQRFYKQNRSFSRVVKLGLDDFNTNQSASYKQAVRKILGLQFYKLGYWKTSLNQINYRRFSTVSDLIAVCVEQESVFELSHRLVRRLISEGRVTGLRIDHIDGLLEPGQYLNRLASWRRVLRPGSPSHGLYVIAEKILGQSEELPATWKIFGTTGYEYLRDVDGIFIDSRNAARFEAIYSKFILKRTDFTDIAYKSRKYIIANSLKAEIDGLSTILARICAGLDGGFALRKIRHAVIEFASCFPVYRTYNSGEGRRPTKIDQKLIEKTLLEVVKRWKAKGEGLRLLCIMRRVLCLEMPNRIPKRERKLWMLFVLKFQQVTATVAAKGVEDTAFYLYNKLVSLNEVGGNPEAFGISVEQFHKRNMRRLEIFPSSMLCTSSHDTKRSEDVRSRINVLSEIPEEWERALNKWSRLNKNKKSKVRGRLAPSKNDEYLLYQTLLGTWPIEYSVSVNKNFEDRMVAYMIKAARESKAYTTWIEKNEEYEAALEKFVRGTIRDSTRSGFVSNMLKLERIVSYCGMLNSISRTLLKLTSPGVPDTYQGTEIWDYSLVDPDNRRQVDFNLRRKMLSNLEREIHNSTDLSKLATGTLQNLETGAIKMYVIKQTLSFRVMNKELFSSGEYIPLKAVGPKQDHVCSFARRLDDRICVIIAPRMYAGLLEGARYETVRQIWEGTKVVLPKLVRQNHCRDIFTGETFVLENQKNSRRILDLSTILDSFPIALLSFLNE